MADEPNQPPVVSIPPHETHMVFSGPAPFVNKSYVHVAGLQARLTFAELPPGGLPPIFRGAVSIPLPDLLALADLIQKVAKDHMQRSGIKIEMDQPPGQSNA
jgi:hypothetical protein